MKRLLLAAMILALAAPPALAFDFFGLMKRDKKITRIAPGDGRPASLDPAEAVAMISAFRKANGLGPVTLDQKLTAIAAKHAALMAKRNNLSHQLFGEPGFIARMERGGYDAEVAAENVGTGYHNLDQAMTGWKNSAGHRKNLLNPDVTEIGIAVAYTPKGKFHDYWALVLAKKDERKRNGPDAGPVTGSVSIGGGLIGGAE
jgi:uncharacterized protein YkwD